MPSDEELRKVAEDVRALARSLARDLKDAARAAHQDGRPTAEAVRDGLRDAARGARQELRRGVGGYRPGPGHHRGSTPWRGRGSYRRWDPYRGWGPPPSWGPPGSPGPGDGPPGAPGADPGGSAAVGPPVVGRPGPGPWWPDGEPWRRRPPRRRRLPPVRRRWDATVLLGLLVVVFGLAWLLTAAGVVHLSVESVVACGLILLGAAMVVGGRTDWSISRHAWPILLGAVMVVVLFATSSTFGVPGALAHMSFGDMTATARNGSTVYGGFGKLTVDATGVEPGGTVHIESIVGQTDIEVPNGVALTVDAKVLAGQVCIHGRTYTSGIGASTGQVTWQPPGPAVSSRPVTLDVHQSLGQIIVGSESC